MIDVRKCKPIGGSSSSVPHKKIASRKTEKIPEEKEKDVQLKTPNAYGIDVDSNENQKHKSPTKFAKLIARRKRKNDLDAYLEIIKNKPLLDKAINVTGALPQANLDKFGLNVRDFSPVFVRKEKREENSNTVLKQIRNKYSIKYKKPPTLDHISFQSSNILPEKKYIRDPS
jgi:hypothetical protein